MCKLVHVPQAAVACLLPCRIEREAVEFAQRVNLRPVRATVAVLKDNMIRAACLPPRAAPRNLDPLKDV